jgi:hypothetical protein
MYRYILTKKHPLPKPWELAWGFEKVYEVFKRKRANQGRSRGTLVISR